jgi:hypothetical protein
MFGIDERGQFTVRHFKLDRKDVTASRAKALADYLDRLSITQGELPTDLFKFEKLLHGGAWFLLLFQLAQKLGGGSSRLTLSSKRIDGYYAKRLRRLDFAEELRAASDELATNFGDLLRKRKRIELVLDFTNDPADAEREARRARRKTRFGELDYDKPFAGRELPKAEPPEPKSTSAEPSPPAPK